MPDDAKQKPKGKKRRRLKDLSVDEISLVDSPAVPKARFLIAKRDEDAQMAEENKTEDGGEVDLELFKKIVAETVNEAVEKKLGESLNNLTEEIASVKQEISKQSRSTKNPGATAPSTNPPAEPAAEEPAAPAEKEDEEIEAAEPEAEDDAHEEEPAPAVEEPTADIDDDEPEPEPAEELAEPAEVKSAEDPPPEQQSEVEKAGLMLLQLQEESAALERKAVAKQDEAAIAALGTLSKNIDDMLTQLGDLTKEVKHATGKVA